MKPIKIVIIVVVLAVVAFFAFAHHESTVTTSAPTATSSQPANVKTSFEDSDMGQAYKQVKQIKPCCGRKVK